MTDIKSLKHIDLASITIMGTAINFIGSLIVVIILLIILAINTGSINQYAIISLLAMVFSVLILSIPEYFGHGYFFNFFAPKLKEINLEIVDMEKITNISVFPLALLCSIISLLITLIIYPGIWVGISILSPFLQLLANQGGILLVYIAIFFSNPLIIAYSFLFTFILVAIAASVFNFISPKIGGLKLKLTQEGDMTQINSINYLNLALILGVILAVIGLVIGLILSVIVMNFIAMLSSIIYLVLGGFVIGFILGALLAVFYNFLAPRLGELKIKLI
jgi:hypothetical protein